MVANLRRALFALPLSLALILALPHPSLAKAPASSPGASTQSWWPWHPHHPQPPAAQPPAQTPAQPPAASPGQGGEHEWTFLIYINANNNLDSFGAVNVKQMEKLGSTDKVNIVVELAQQSKSNTFRYLVQKGTDPNNITSPPVQTLPVLDMGIPDTLKDFITWGIQNYPSKKLCVVIWNHGNGWEDSLRVPFKGCSYDDNSGHHLSIPQVGQVLRDVVAARGGKKIDLFGYDCCLMNMIECAAEVKDSVLYQDGSEEVEPGTGYPYDDWFADVVANPTWDGRQVGTSLVQRYVAAYNNGSEGTSDATHSLIDESQITGLMSKLDTFTAACLADAANKPKLAQAAGATQHYYEASYRDLDDYLDQVTSLVTTPAVQQAASDLRSLLVTKDGSGIVAANGSTGTNVSKSHGISIWIPDSLSPTDPLLDSYKKMWFTQNCQWSEYLVASSSTPSQIAKAVAAGVTFNDPAGLAPAFASPAALADLRAAIGAHPRTQAIRDLLRAAQGHVLMH